MNVLTNMQELLKEDNKAYLYMAKEYINYLDFKGFEYVLEKEEKDNEELSSAHHQIIADMLRRVYVNVFNSNEEDMLLWMKEELNEETYNAFSIMDFNDYYAFRRTIK